jgi:hypothetical protein
MTNKLFTIAGTSVLNSILTYRFATGDVSKRLYILNYHGHADVKLFDLPTPMTQEQAIEWLRSEHNIVATMLKGGSKKKATVTETVIAEVTISEDEVMLGFVQDAESATNDNVAAAEAAKRDARNARRRELRAAQKAA